MCNVWVATDLGSLRGVHFTSQQNTVITYDELSHKNEVVSLVPSASRGELYCTLTRDLVNVFDMSENIYVNQYEMEGELVSAFDVGDTLVSCAKSGQVYVWRDEEISEKLKVGENTECCVKALNDNILTGGKECELKMWDLETQKAVFSAKNVPRDSLDIRVPVWVRSITTLRTEPHIVCVGSHYAQYRMYDTRVKRRPVLDMNWEELPIISLTADDMYCYLGNTKGDIARLDLRTGRNMCKYRGPVGSVRGLALNPGEPYLASVGLDRHLRVHDTETRELVHKCYLKNRLNCAVWTDVKVNEVQEVEKDVWEGLEEISGDRKRIKC